MAAIFLACPVEGEYTRRLQDLNGVLNDLRWTAGVCNALVRRHDSPEKLDQIAEAMETAAIIRYCRTFSGGVRDSFNLQTDLLHQLTEQQRALHQFIGDLRNKHIAHSVNDWELNRPVAHLRKDERTGERVFASNSCEHHRIIGLPSETINEFGQLAATLADMVENQLNAEKAAVLERVRKTLTVDDAEAAARMHPRPPGAAGHVAKRRL